MQSTRGHKQARLPKHVTQLESYWNTMYAMKFWKTGQSAMTPSRCMPIRE